MLPAGNRALVVSSYGGFSNSMVFLVHNASQRSAQGDKRIVIEERNLFSKLSGTSTDVKTEEKHSLELRPGMSRSKVC